MRFNTPIVSVELKTQKRHIKNKIGFNTPIVSVELLCQGQGATPSPCFNTPIVSVECGGVSLVPSAVEVSILQLYR